MNRKGDKALIVGLDIGTSKVVALVGEYSPGNPIEVIGIGSHESRGLKRGVVVDIESTVQSIQRAVEEAELMAGCEIRSVYASISGNHVQCRNSPGIVPIRDGEVTWGDLDRVLEAAKAVATAIVEGTKGARKTVLATFMSARGTPPVLAPIPCYPFPESAAIARRMASKSWAMASAR